MELQREQLWIVSHLYLSRFEKCVNAAMDLVRVRVSL